MISIILLSILPDIFFLCNNKKAEIKKSQPIQWDLFFAALCAGFFFFLQCCKLVNFLLSYWAVEQFLSFHDTFPFWPKAKKQ